MYVLYVHKDVLRCHTDWLLQSHLQKLVLVVASVASGEVMERWTFDVHADAAGQAGYVLGCTDDVDALMMLPHAAGLPPSPSRRSLLKSRPSSDR